MLAAVGLEVSSSLVRVARISELCSTMKVAWTFRSFPFSSNRTPRSRTALEVGGSVGMKPCKTSIFPARYRTAFIRDPHLVWTAKTGMRGDRPCCIMKALNSRWRLGDWQKTRFTKAHIRFSSSNVSGNCTNCSRCARQVTWLALGNRPWRIVLFAFFILLAESVTKAHTSLKLVLLELRQEMTAWDTVLKLTRSRKIRSAATGGLPTGWRRIARTQRPQASVVSSAITYTGLPCTACLISSKYWGNNCGR